MPTQEKPAQEVVGPVMQQLIARVIAVEVIAMMAMGLYLSNSRNDADYGKAGALIESMAHGIAGAAADAGLPTPVQAMAVKHGNALLARITENLRTLRGEGGALN